MNRTLLALALSATLAGSAWAELKIAGETKIRTHKMTVLSAAGAPDGSAVLWDYDEDKLDAREWNGKLFVTGPAGRYRIKMRAVTLKDGRAEAETARAELVIEGDGTPTPPTTPPTPPKEKDRAADPMAALGRIRFGSAGCTATVVSPRRADGKWDVLTANHCIERVGVGARGTMTLRGGRSFGVTVTAAEKSSDIAWLVTDDATLADLPFAVLARSLPEKGAKVWHAGFGVDVPGNREDGEFVEANASGMIRMNLSVSSGDSGGGIFRADTNELIGTTCCTAGIARKTDMWAGHSLRAAQLRPKAGVAEPECCLPPELRDAVGDRRRLVHPIALYAD